MNRKNEIEQPPAAELLALFLPVVVWFLVMEPGALYTLAKRVPPSHTPDYCGLESRDELWDMD